MRNQPRAVPLEQISKWISDAATTKSWRPGHHVGSAVSPDSLDAKSHSARIHAALQRARAKTFVRMVKPFRRLFRNQGAVNDSVIEAVHHLAAQNQEMIDEINDLRGMIIMLRDEVRRLRAIEAGVEDADPEDSCE